MGYKGCCSGSGCGNCAEYNLNSHGDIGAHYNSLIRVDLPEYTRPHYTPSRNEVFADFNYSKIEVGYDSNLRNIKESFEGKPLEAYIPAPVIMPDNASACPTVIIRNPEIMPKQTVVEEIMKAQAEVMRKKQAEHSVEPSVIIRTTEVEQELHLKRRLRRVEILQKENI